MINKSQHNLIFTISLVVFISVLIICNSIVINSINSLYTADGENNQGNNDTNKKAAVTKAALANDESMSYSSLVREAGF